MKATHHPITERHLVLRTAQTGAESTLEALTPIGSHFAIWQDSDQPTIDRHPEDSPDWVAPAKFDFGRSAKVSGQIGTLAMQRIIDAG